MNQIIMQPNSTGAVALDAQNQEKLHEIYERLTKRPLLLFRKYFKAYQFDFSHIEDLDGRIIQKAASHHASLKSLEVTVSYLNDGGARFNSLGEFLKHSKSNQDPIKNVEFLYTFMLSPNEAAGPQSIKITVDLYSLIAIQKEYKDEQFPIEFFGFLGTSSTIRIEHESYPVAESFLNVFDKWLSVLPQGEGNKYSTWFAKRLTLIRLFAALVVLGMLPFAILWVPYPNWDLNNASYLSALMAIILSAVYICSRASDLITEFIIRDLKSVWQMGYIKITAGDDKLINEVQEKNKKSALFTLPSLLQKGALATASAIYVILMTQFLNWLVS